jgi:hypothetical protein
MMSQRICFLAGVFVASLVGVGCNKSMGPQEPKNDPNAKIFFLGEINGIEAVPQPFVSHLVQWAFE